jgi:GMP synthase (glutamine-hydrolysing)
VLVVEHEAIAPAGWVGEWLEEAGEQLDVRRPYLGDPLPHDLGGHAGMLVLGGSMDAYADDEAPWLPQVRSLVVQATGGPTPTLGICLGHQLIAVALGGRVRRNPRGQQVGIVPFGWLPGAEQDALFRSVTAARRGVQWNSDCVDEVPEGAVVLARSSGGEVQAVRFAAHVWGIQSHPEVGAKILQVWADDDREDAIEHGVDVDAHVAAVAAAESELREAWQPLVDAFAARLREVRAS